MRRKGGRGGLGGMGMGDEVRRTLMKFKKQAIATPIRKT
jgi:hypothetical protein